MPFHERPLADVLPKRPRARSAVIAEADEKLFRLFVDADGMAFVDVDPRVAFGDLDGCCHRAKLTNPRFPVLATGQSAMDNYYRGTCAHVIGSMRKDWRRRCNARTRKGTPCRRRELLRGGRCRNHGGMSTGPKTPEGKRRPSAMASGASLCFPRSELVPILALMSR